MFVTLDILQKRGAHKEYLDFFAKHYPDGVELLHLIEKEHIPEHDLHWCYQWLDPNQEEIDAYWKKVKVVDSEGVHESYDVARSTLVSKSRSVNDSEQIYSSEQISKSDHIVNSNFVNNSHHIATSEFVDESSYILGSKNVNNSSQVLDSVYTVLSHGIYESENIVNCHSIWKSENLTDCYFCFGCHNVNNALFCEDISDGEYYLFNKKIDKARFDMICAQYKRYATPFITLMDEWPQSMDQHPAKYYDYRKHTENVPDKFYAWVKTLPGYDPAIMYSVTFDSRFLI